MKKLESNKIHSESLRRIVLFLFTKNQVLFHYILLPNFFLVQNCQTYILIWLLPFKMLTFTGWCFVRASLVWHFSVVVFFLFVCLFAVCEGFVWLGICFGFFLDITSYSCHILKFGGMFSGRFTEVIMLQMTTQLSLPFKTILEVQSFSIQRYNF